MENLKPVKIITRLRNHKIFIWVAAAYTVWAAFFIFRSSTIAIDGRRYFSLFDDAMISMRYAWNFSHGFGFVWNPGERVEGYTNLLMTMIMSVFIRVFDNITAVLAVQITGLIIVLVCAWLVWKNCDFLGEDLAESKKTNFKLFVLILVLTYYPLSYWSLMGMETGLVTLLLLLSIYLIQLYLQESQAGYLIALGGLQGLAYLSRPDAVIYSLPIFAFLFLSEMQKKTKVRYWYVGLLFMILIYFLFIVGQEIFRVSFYHELLPNTYYLKLTGMSLADRLKNGLGFVTPYVFLHLFFLIIACWFVLIKPNLQRILLLILAILPLFYQIWVGGDPWAYWRIMTPGYPFLIILFSLGLFMIVEKLAALRTEEFASRLLVYSFVTVFLVSNFTFLPEIVFVRKPHQTNDYEVLINTSLVLDEITTQDATVGLFWAGIIPYYSNRNAIDFLGKNDKYIAMLPPDLSGAVAWNGMYSVPGHNKYDLNYSIKVLQPTYIQSPIWQHQDITPWVSENYILVEYKGLNLWLKKDSPAVNWQMLTP